MFKWKKPQPAYIVLFLMLLLLLHPIFAKQPSLTNNPDDVEGLVAIKEVSATVCGNGYKSHAKARAGAVKQLKQTARKMEANIVLVQVDTFTKASFCSYLYDIKGIAYTQVKVHSKYAQTKATKPKVKLFDGVMLIALALIICLALAIITRSPIVAVVCLVLVAVCFAIWHTTIFLNGAISWLIHTRLWLSIKELLIGALCLLLLLHVINNVDVRLKKPWEW